MNGNLAVAALRIREDYRTLTGPEKAAIMMLALGEEHATKLFTHMDDEESANCPDHGQSGHGQFHHHRAAVRRVRRADLLHRLAGRHL